MSTTETCWCVSYIRGRYPHVPGCPNAGKTVRQLIEDIKRTARGEAIEEAAAIVEQCNREGPYNAIGAAPRIRALAEKRAEAEHE